MLLLRVILNGLSADTRMEVTEYFIKDLLKLTNLSNYYIFPQPIVRPWI